jgi:hypothetical protein
MSREVEVAAIEVLYDFETNALPGAADEIEIDLTAEMAGNDARGMWALTRIEQYRASGTGATHGPKVRYASGDDKYNIVAVTAGPVATKVDEVMDPVQFHLANGKLYVLPNFDAGADNKGWMRLQLERRSGGQVLHTQPAP